MECHIHCRDFVTARRWLRLAHPGIDIRIESRVVGVRFDGTGDRQAIRQYHVYGRVNGLPASPPPPSITPQYRS